MHSKLQFMCFIQVCRLSLKNNTQLSTPMQESSPKAPIRRPIQVTLELSCSIQWLSSGSQYQRSRNMSCHSFKTLTKSILHGILISLTTHMEDQQREERRGTAGDRRDGKRSTGMESKLFGAAQWWSTRVLAAQGSKMMN